MSEFVRITDVAPRDGLQNEPGIIPTEEKVELVRLLCETGVDEVEVTSFVSPKWVPQLGDGSELLDLLRARGDSGSPSQREGAGGRSRAPVFSALVPNDRGLQGVLDANARAKRPLISKVSLFTAASETFSLRNTNATIAQTLDRFVPVVSSARIARLEIRGYLSCVIACPFEGRVDPRIAAQWAFVLYDMGIPEIDLGDTIGAATPESVIALLNEVGKVMDGEDAKPILTLHLHDTHGRAADCVRAALDLGVRSFDGSVAGLGGCPYASTPGRRAPGNISTQTLVRTIHDAGYHTNVDLDKLEEAGRFAMKIVTAARQRAADASAEIRP